MLHNRRRAPSPKRAVAHGFGREAADDALDDDSHGDARTGVNAIYVGSHTCRSLAVPDGSLTMMQHHAKMSLLIWRKNRAVAQFG